MLKEDIIGQVEVLAADQEKYNKFKEYVLDFSRVPRCKKGVLEFLDDLYNSKNVAGLQEMAIELLTDKTMINANLMTVFIMNHQITKGNLQALKDQRELIMCGIAKYIMEVYERIQESGAEDKVERHLGLRVAVARLRGLLGGTHINLKLDTVDWSLIEPAEWLKVEEVTLEELVNPICDKKIIQEWADAWGDAQGLDQVKMLLSLRSYLNYLDTFWQE